MKGWAARVFFLGLLLLGGAPGYSDEAAWKELNLQAMKAAQEGKTGAAIGHVEKALAMARAEKNALNTYKSLNNLGVLHLSARDLAEARKDFDEALALMEAEQGKDAPAVVDTLVNRSKLEILENNAAAAVSDLERALRLCEKHYGAESAQTGAVLRTIVPLYQAMGLVEEARAGIERLKKIVSSAR
ncbi:MAG: tetratricopeptide repeat protein [Candidatus Omnitrophota bacterium]